MRAVIAGNWINVYFRYDPVMVGMIKTVPDREYQDKDRRWRVPATPWHAKRLIELFNGSMPDEVRELAKSEAKLKVKQATTDARLRPYQRKAVDFVRAIGGRALIGDDCGLGKTPESLVYARDEPSIHTVLVVAPANVVYKWGREVKTWMGEDALVIETHKTPIDPTVNVHVMSYEIARDRAAELTEIGYDLLIVDECHYIKSYKAQRTRAVKLVAEEIEHVLGLSGTPFLSKPIEMFNMLHLLQPKNFPNWFKFGIRYGGGRYCRGFTGATNVEELRGRLERVMIRRLKSEVKGELPALTRAKMPVIPSNMKMYWAIKHEVPEAIRTMRAGRETASKDYFENGLEKLTLLREVVGQGKVDAAIDWANSFLEQTPPERKLVVYAHHDTVVQALKAGLTEWGVGCIIGGVSKKERDAIQRNFQTAQMPRVLIISSAGGIGIDLFGIGEIQCSDMLVVEREWTSADEEQVESRLHRQGQHDAVNVWILISKGTNDEDNDELIDARRELMDDVIRVNKFKSISAELIQRMEAEDEGTVRKGKLQAGKKGCLDRAKGGRGARAVSPKGR